MSTLRRLRIRGIPASDDSWIHSASSTAIIVVSVFVGFVVFGIAAMWEWLASKEGWPLLPMAFVSDAIAGGLAGLFIFTFLRNVRARRIAILHRLSAIREMNHEIRNALELIQLSAYTTQHKQAIEIITTAVDKIQWTLREIIPANEREHKASSGGQASQH